MKSPVHIADRCGDRGGGVFLGRGLPIRGMGGVGKAGGAYAFMFLQENWGLDYWTL